MNNSICLLLMFIPCLSYGASDRCTTAAVLTKIRPGAAWAMQGDSIKTLKWLDTKQSKPTESEVDKAKQSCIADVQTREVRKAKARLEIKDPATPVEKKVDDLILLLDMDK